MQSIIEICTYPYTIANLFSSIIFVRIQYSHKYTIAPHWLRIKTTLPEKRTLITIHHKHKTECYHEQMAHGNQKIQKAKKLNIQLEIFCRKTIKNCEEQ